MRKKILLLGNTGKMGVALTDVFSGSYSVYGKNSRDFDANNFEQVRALIDKCAPDIVINTVALTGIDLCEREPEKAFRLNALYPKFLAEVSTEKRYLLVHFSTDGIFNDEKDDFYTESDRPSPLHVYGMTKYGGDCFVQALAKRYYIVRIPILFGETRKRTQFMEKMLDRAGRGEKILKVSGDVVSSPTYSRDVAKKIEEILETELPYEIYHVANAGKASLYDLMKEVVDNLKLGVTLERVSHDNFPSTGVKNTNTPIKSEKITALRPWRKAVQEYCNRIRNGSNGDGYGG